MKTQPPATDKARWWELRRSLHDVGRGVRSHLNFLSSQSIRHNPKINIVKVVSVHRVKPPNHPTFPPRLLKAYGIDIVHSRMGSLQCGPPKDRARARARAR